MRLCARSLRWRVDARRVKLYSEAPGFSARGHTQRPRSSSPAVVESARVALDGFGVFTLYLMLSLRLLSESFLRFKI